MKKNWSCISLGNANGKEVTFFPLPRFVYVWWKALGLFPFFFVEKEMIRYSRWGYTYTLMLLLVYSILYFRAVRNRIDYSLPRETSAVVVADFFALSTEFLMVVVSWLCAALRLNELRKILKNFKRVYARAKLIGIGQNYNKWSRRLKIYVVIVNLIWLFLYCSAHMLLVNNKSFSQSVWMPFNLPRIVTHNVVIVFINILIIVKEYFYLLNRKIDKLSDGDTILETFQRKRSKLSKHYSLRSNMTPNALEIYGQMHSDLVTFTKRVVNFLSLSIILVQLVRVIEIASDLYIMYMMAKSREYWTKRVAFVFGVLTGWVFFHLSEIVIMMDISDSTAKEADQAGKQLHKMLTSGDTQKYVNTGQLLSLRLLHRRLTISLWGLFQMKLSVVHTIFGTVGTYIMVMVQLDNQILQEAKLNKSSFHSARTFGAE